MASKNQKTKFYKAKINGQQIKIEWPDLSYTENPLVKQMRSDIYFDMYDFIQSKIVSGTDKQPVVPDQAETVVQPAEQPQPVEQPVAEKEPVIVAETKPEVVAEPTQTVAVSEKSNLPKYPVQTEDFCNINDIFAICVKDQNIKDLNISDFKLTEEIRKQMRTFDRQIRFNPKTNANISCISKSNVPALLNKVIAMFQKTARKKMAQKQPQNNQNEQKKLLVSRKDVTLIPIVITKYIPKKLWKDICRACGKDVIKQKKVLDNINAVNTEVTETVSSTHLQIIKPDTHERTTSSYLKREDGNSIVQSITEPLYKDNKRIVWAYLPTEKMLVCTGVFAEHTKTKNGNSYSATRDYAAVGLDADGKEITMQRIKDEGYLNVSDLLKNGGKEIDFEQKTEIKEAKPAAAIRPSISTSVPEQTKTPEIKKVDKKTFVMPNIKIKNMVDVHAAKSQIEGLINMINQTVNQNLIAVTNEQDVSVQIKQLDLARDALVQKAKYEIILTEFDKTNDVLKQLQAYTNSHQK